MDGLDAFLTDEFVKRAQRAVSESSGEKAFGSPSEEAVYG